MTVVYYLIKQHVRWSFLFAVWTFSISSSCQTLKQNSVMPNPIIRFIPATFNDLELGYLSNSLKPCSPLYPERAISHLRNEVLINAPEKIVISSSLRLDSLQPVIPVCIAFVITEYFGYKYAHLIDEEFHIRKMDSGKSYTGILYDESLLDGSPLAPDPTQEEWGKEREMRVVQAQSYSNDELNGGQASSTYRNLNLMQYVDMPFEPGVYEIYYTLKGLESNRVQVEIVFEE